MQIPEAFYRSDGDGILIKCETLFSFESDISGSNRCYIVYTDNSTTDEGFTSVYASRFNSEQQATAHGEFACLKLDPIDDPKEWAIIEEILDAMSTVDD